MCEANPVCWVIMEYIFTFQIIAFAFYAFFQYLFSAMKNGKIRVF